MGSEHQKTWKNILMKLDKLENFNRGWIIGNFEPSLFKGSFEVGIKEWHQGQSEDFHCHRLSEEINIIGNGAVVFKFLDGKEVTCRPGDILTIEKNEYTSLKEVLSTRATIIVIRPEASSVSDKYILKKEEAHDR